VTSVFFLCKPHYATKSHNTTLLATQAKNQPAIFEIVCVTPWGHICFHSQTATYFSAFFI